jgi:hypothetical protein
MVDRMTRRGAGIVTVTLAAILGLGACAATAGAADTADAAADVPVGVEVPDADAPDAPADVPVPETGPGEVRDDKAVNDGSGPACPAFGETVVAATVTADEVHETSGLAASRIHPGILWTHEDSGAGPSVYALGTDGQVKRRFDLEGVQAVDWEDIARGPLDGLEGDALFIGDVGDNGRERPFVTVHVVAEPKRIDPSDPPGMLQVLVSMDLAYPVGPQDCEAMLVDPVDGAVYLFPKESLEGGMNRVFRKAPPHVETAEPVLLEQVALVPTFVPTGASASADGGVLVVRNPFGGVLYRRQPGSTASDTFSGPSCPLPPFPDEPTGEAIALAPDGSGYWSISEFGSRSRQDLHWTALAW